MIEGSKRKALNVISVVGCCLLFTVVVGTSRAIAADEVFDESKASAEAISRADEGWWAESMKTKDDRIAWWREARFGCFMHWGVYSVLDGEWQGEPVHGYAEHIQRIKKIDQATYRKEAVEKFNPVKFNADEWAALLKRAGMHYLIITSKHHDGFAMFDSDVSDYNVVDATPFARDPMRELKDACARQGIHFGFYYSQAFDWGEKNGAGNDWEFHNPGGDKLIGGRNWWETIPEEFPRIKAGYTDKKSIPQIRELLKKYDPDIMWFDTSSKLPFSENLRILEEIRKVDPDVVVNGRLARGHGRNFGDYINTSDRAAEFSTVGGDWEAIPTTNESYGHHKHDHSHKPPEHFIRLLAKAVSRNGNLLLNVGPMADGRIDPIDVAILEAIGDWLKVNGESIYGCGLTPLPIQFWGTSTRKDNVLYLQVFDWPTDGKLIVGGLKSDPASVELITAEGKKKLSSKRSSALDFEISVPDKAPSAIDSVIKLTFTGEIETDPVRLLDSGRSNQLLTFDAERIGRLGNGDGKRNRYYISRMDSPDKKLTWTIRLNEPAVFDVTVTYVPGDPQGRGHVLVKSDDQELSKEVVPVPAGQENYTDSLGTLKLEAGVHEITLSSPDVSNGEIFRPLELRLASK